MKTLIVYYSRTGTTKLVSETVAKAIGADLGEIMDKKDRSGIKGYIVGGADALKKRPTEIGEPAFDPASYERVIVATPVWAGTMAPALRTYLIKHSGEIASLAIIVTQGAKPPKQEGIFTEIAELCGREAQAKLHLSTKEARSGDLAALCESFVLALHSSAIDPELAAVL